MSSARPLNFTPEGQGLSEQKVYESRCDMAAMFRIAALEDLHEGIDNHFSYALADGTFLVNRWGVHWSRMRSSDVLRVDNDGRVLEGEGVVETTAFYIHEAVHRLCPHATVILHTHMPYATALTCVEGGLNETLSQASLFFFDEVVYEVYGGLANDRQEGERLAANIGSKRYVMLENHGPMVLGPTPGIAIHDLYFLERASKLQILAQSQGAGLKQIPRDVARLTARQIAELDADKETYFDVMKGILDESGSEYRS